MENDISLSMSKPEISFLRRSTFITALFWSIFSLLASDLHAETRQPLAKGQNELKILAFGDSITAGYRLPQGEAYPAQLEKLMRAEGYKVSVINAGVSGDTSAQGLRRIDWNLKNKNYHWVILGLGANDGLRQLPVAQMQTNLSHLIEKIKKNNSKILFLGMKLPTNYSLAYGKQFESAFPHLAKKYNLPFVPFALEGVALESTKTLEDQIHPNAEGHKKVAQNIWKLLKPRLTQ